MKYKTCGYYNGQCPCFSCNEPCACIFHRDPDYVVDTDKLCDKAKKYCESGRE